MGTHRTTHRQLARDTLLAALVLALAFLNFGHSSAVFAAGGRVVVSATSVCGDPLAPNAGEHFACHACRPDLAALPPPPCDVAPVTFAVALVAYAAPGTPCPASVLTLPWSARAPPFT